MQYQKISLQNISNALCFTEVEFFIKLGQNSHLMYPSTDLWRASIGHFHVSSKCYYQGKTKLSHQFLPFYVSLIAYLANIIHQSLNSKYSFFGLNILVFINLILLCSHIAENLGPKIKPNDNLYVCHSNVNSIPSHKLRIAVLESFVAIHNWHNLQIRNFSEHLQR